MSKKKYVGFSLFTSLLDWVNALNRDELAACTLWWVVNGEYPYIIQCHEHIRERAKKYGGEMVQLSHMPISENQTTLDQLWRYARPYRSQGGISPKYWLFMIEDQRDDLYRELAMCLRMGGQLVTCSLRSYGSTGSTEGSEQRLAVRASGIDADLLAHRSLLGVTALGVFESEHHQSALPPGWTPPILPAVCWPSHTEMIYYQDLDDLEHSHVLLQVIHEGAHLIDLVRWSPPQVEFISRQDGLIPKEANTYTLQVDTRLARERKPMQLGVTESCRVVFRFKSTIDHLAAHLIQAINQQEGNMLPDLKYAAVDWDDSFSFDGPERWHYLYGEHITGAQLSAWGLVDRYELNEALERDGLPNVFVDSASVISPPLELLVDARSKNSLENLKDLLHRPHHDELTLIERGEESVEVPLITKIKLKEMRPFGEVIREVTDGWNSGELQRASDKLMEPEHLVTWREESKRALDDIVALEHQALLNTNHEALSILREEGERAIKAMQEASEPVLESIAIAQALTQRIVESDRNYERVCGALAEVSQRLTEPRRKWISDQTKASAEALARSAPVVADLNSVREKTDQLVKSLSERSETLSRASTVIVDRQASWLAQQSTSEQIASNARRELDTLDATAKEANRRISQARDETRQRLSEAQAIHKQVRARQEELERERRAVEALVAQNRAIHEENERNQAEYARRRAEAEREQARVVNIRDVVVPQLKREAEGMERELQALNPRLIEQNYKEAKAKHDDISKKLIDAKNRHAQTQSELKNVEKISQDLDLEIKSTLEKHNQACAKRDKINQNHQALTHIKLELNTIRNKNNEMSRTGLRDKDIIVKREIVEACNNILGKEISLIDRFLLSIVSRRN